MNDKAKDPSGVNQVMVAWLLAAISAGLGVVAIASCGIPFVAPSSTFAIVLGVAGCLAAVASVGCGFVSRRSVKATLIVIAGVLLAVNGFAIWIGRLGRHLIDYLEGL